MPSCLKELADNRAIELAKNELDCYSKNHKDVYFWLLNNRLVPKGEQFILDVIRCSRGIIFPMDTKYIENYLEGYKFQYIPFNYPHLVLDKADGFWELSKENETVKIWYNSNRPPKRQQYSKIHELIHFYQTLDPEFRRLIDFLLTETSMPKTLIEKLADKMADKMTAMYLMPKNYFIAKCRETTDVNKLSEFFQASPSSVRYRLKECGISQQYQQ